MSLKRILALSLVALAAAAPAKRQTQAEGNTTSAQDNAGRLILVGGYNRTTEVLRFNPFVEPNTLELVSRSDGGDPENKAWLIRHPVNPNILLGTNDHAVANATGYVSSYLLDPATGGITFIDHRDSGGVQTAGGVATAHGAFFPDGKTAAAVNSTFKFDPITGKFGKQINNGSILDYAGYTTVDGQIAASQDTSHPHMILTHPWLPVLYLPDLGEDTLRRFTIGDGGVLSPLEPYPQKLGSGPRHGAISANGQWLYLLHELDITVSVYKIDTDTKDGDLSLVQEGIQIYDQNTTFSLNLSSAEIHVSNDGRFLYASNRNLTSATVIAPEDPSDTIAVWAIDQSTGELTRKQSAMAFGARQIRSFELSPAIATASAGGEDFIVAGGLTTNNTFVFKRDKTDGTLTLAAEFTNGVHHSRPLPRALIALRQQPTFLRALMSTLFPLPPDLQKLLPEFKAWLDPQNDKPRVTLSEREKASGKWPEDLLYAEKLTEIQFELTPLRKQVRKALVSFFQSLQKSDGDPTDEDKKAAKDDLGEVWDQAKELAVKRRVYYERVEGEQAVEARLVESTVREYVRRGVGMLFGRRAYWVGLRLAFLDVAMNSAQDLLIDTIRDLTGLNSSTSKSKPPKLPAPGTPAPAEPAPPATTASPEEPAAPVGSVPSVASLSHRHGRRRRSRRMTANLSDDEAGSY
ncbi:hypothetical protein MNV49_005196 [Pseudohyphozyma bogoriensis]|nr:hypothetical protein MNV49_005196 [Pseudohyphozyma bogoriensis]